MTTGGSPDAWIAPWRMTRAQVGPVLCPRRAARGPARADRGDHRQHRGPSGRRHGSDRRRLVPDGQRRPLGLPGRRRGTRTRDLARFVLDRRRGRLQRGLCFLHRGDRIRDRGGAIRLVVRLRGAPAGRLPAHPGGGRGALVAQGGGSRLAAPRGPAVVARRSPRSPRLTCLLERRPGVLHLGGQAPADRGRVGVRGPRGTRRQGLPLGRRARAGRRAPDERLAGRLPDQEHRTPTATTEPAPWTPSRPTATGCTT